ncbi:MAG: transcriptional repressor [Acutalibacteraceae bacterium]|nr:transcriptional repressor [Acutalibacteraceae bacterium]
MATKQRSLILDIVKNMDGHLSADEIYILARESMPGIALATVYNNLNALYNTGEIGKVKIADSADLYDRSPILHDHLICKNCKTVTDFNIPDMKSHIENCINDTILSYNLNIDYICKKCRK